MKNKKVRSGSSPGSICIVVGVLSLVAAFCFTGYNLWDDSRAQSAAESSYEELEQAIPQGDEVWQGVDSIGETQTPDYLLDPNREMPTLEVDGASYIGTLDIPALGLSLPVQSEWSYENLRLSPCRYTGSAYNGTLILAAHNYRAHFGSIHRLSIGDSITFTDADGNIFSYVVSEVEQLQPSAVEEIREGDWALTLFTCTLGGQSRVVVRCTSAEEIEE